MNVGERIKKRREELGLTQLELAQRLGYKDRSTIAYIEKDGGRLSIPKVQEFAKALSVSPEYLMGWDIADEIKPDGLNFIFEVPKEPENKEDAELLELFHSMSKEGQEVALNVLKGLAPQYKKSDSVKEMA